VEAQQIRALEQTGYPVLETSAKLGMGVDELFTQLAQQWRG